MQHWVAHFKGIDRLGEVEREGGERRMRRKEKDNLISRREWINGRKRKREREHDWQLTALKAGRLIVGLKTLKHRVKKWQIGCEKRLPVTFFFCATWLPFMPGVQTFSHKALTCDPDPTMFPWTNCRNDSWRIDTLTLNRLLATPVDGLSED